LKRPSWGKELTDYEREEFNDSLLNQEELSKESIILVNET
jgi:hypothetical protein